MNASTLSATTREPDRNTTAVGTVSPAVANTSLEAHGGLSLLHNLHCPYCESPLELVFTVGQTVRSANGNSSDYGILRCACGHHPVIHGIPVLQHTEGLNRVLNRIKAGDCRGALLQALNLFRVKWANRTRWHQLRYNLNCRRVVARPDLSFAQAVDLLRRPRGFSNYLYHRYANPSFLAAMAPLLLLNSIANPAGGVGTTSQTPGHDGSPVRVLDLACGAGHASFLIRLLYPDISLICADQDFVSLYLAKRYQAPDAAHVCIDTEAPSPFPDGYFDGVFCLDAFHYFHAKIAIISELKRVIAGRGIWIFPHLHNALQSNITAGIPLSPEDYLRLFSGIEPKLFSELEVLRALSSNLSFDWCTGKSAEELQDAPALTLVAGSEEQFGTKPAPLSAFCRQPDRLAINPIYSVVRKGSKAFLTLKWPDEMFRNECKSVEDYLPSTFVLDADDLCAIADGTLEWAAPRTQELLSCFVVVPLPARYSD